MAISSIGIGSGLKVDDILSELRKVENQSLQLVQNRQIENTQRISAYSKLKSTIENLQKAGKALNNPDTYGAVKVSSSNELVSATGTAKASPGKYTLNIESIATSQTLLAKGQESRTEAIGSNGSITITLADGKAHTIDLEGKDTSLEGIMRAINADNKAGVSATLINDGSSQPHRLLLTANDTGSQASVASIQVQGNEALAQFLGFSDTEPNVAISATAAKNAVITINDIPITQQSNVLKDTIEGLSIDISKGKIGEQTTLTVSRDDSAASKAIKDFVTAYNTLNATTRELTRYDVDAQKGAALTGDSMVRRVQSSMHQALGFATNEGDIRTLSQLGIKTDPNTGEMSIDDEKLSAGIRDHLEDVKRLFAGEDALGARLDEAGKLYTKKGGFIDNAIEGATRTDKLLQDQYESTELRINTRLEAYRKQFSQLDTMMTQMQGISSYLTQQLSMLSNLNNSNK